jgi:serine protease Do
LPRKFRLFGEWGDVQYDARIMMVRVLFVASLFASTALAQTPAKPVEATAKPAEKSAPPTQAQAEARRLSDAFVGVAEKVSPSVVQLDVAVREDSGDAIMKLFGKGAGEAPISRGLGSGVVFSQDGAILTNNHVIEDALSINVRLRDGRYLPAKVIGRDPSMDLAVVKIEASGLTAAKFADSDSSRVGEWVVAIGSPFGFGYTVTSGVLSAKGRGGLGMSAIEDYLQTDASINPGNSGGPLCDLDGRVIGINTMVVGRGSGIGFAVPSNMARKVADQLLKTGKVERAWIGVGFQDLTPDLAKALNVDANSGALVNSITDGSPAARANIRTGDIIAAVAGKRVNDGRALVREILQHDVGTTVQLEIVRDGKHYGATCSLVARPEPPVEPLPVQAAQAPQKDLGVAMRDLKPETASQLGVGNKVLPVITQVTPGSAADRAGLKVNDVVVEADGVIDPNTNKVLELAKDGQLLLRVRRGAAAFYAALKK